jgi:hypothetical protein
MTASQAIKSKKSIIEEPKNRTSVLKPKEVSKEKFH